MARVWTKDEDAQILRMHRDKMPIVQIAKAMKATASQIRHRVYMHKDDEQPSGEGDDEVEVVYSGDDGKISYIGKKINTPDELLDYAKIDREVWEISEVKINTWEVAGKKKNGQDENGNYRAETLWKTPLRQISLKLRRRAPKCVQEGIRDILSKVPSWRGKLPKITKPRRSADHLLEVSLYDVHFGKAAFNSNGGDLQQIHDDFIGAAEDLLDRLNGFKIEKVIFPVGNDLLNFDTLTKTTTRGTPVECTEDKMSKVFSTAYDAVQNVIMKCREIAEVEVVWVPSNHDRMTCWFLCETLRRVFEGDKHVTIDNGPSTRKYREYGSTLVGYTHGDLVSQANLPLVMANEAAESWARCVFKTFRIGHFHKKKQTRWVGNDTFCDLDVTVLPSLSSTDTWHFDQGFVGGHRMAECAIWNRDTGPVGNFMVEARSSVASRKKG